MNDRTLVVRHEGLRLKPYCDRCGVNITAGATGYVCGCTPKAQSPGSITIGRGRNLSGNGITENEASWMLDRDVNEVEIRLGERDWWNALDEVRKAAIVDLAFNVGVKGVDKFVGVIWGLQHQDWNRAAEELRASLAEHQEPRRINELAVMLETGQWPTVTY